MMLEKKKKAWGIWELPGWVQTGPCQVPRALGKTSPTSAGCAGRCVEGLRTATGDCQDLRYFHGGGLVKK